MSCFLFFYPKSHRNLLRTGKKDNKPKLRGPCAPAGSQPVASITQSYTYRYKCMFM